MAVNRKSSRRQSGSGQALVEFALVIPLLFLLIINVLNFGGLLYAWITVSNAARTGAQYKMMGSAYIFGPSPPTAAQVETLVRADLLSLPNRDAGITVLVCTNVEGTVSPVGCSAPTDPEPSTYVSGTVDVTYTYVPFVNLWDFSALGIHLTLPPTTVHRKTVMRLAGGG